MFENMDCVIQPRGSKCCGQACVAMFLGTDLAEGIRLVGHDKKTRYCELRDAMRGVGAVCPDRLTLVPMTDPAFPDVCLIRIYWGESWQGTHWAIKNGAALFDPAYGLLEWNDTDWLIPNPKIRAEYKKTRITSFAEIEIPELLQ